MTKFLDPLDSAFILLENPGTSMNIGAVDRTRTPTTSATPRSASTTIRPTSPTRIHEIPVLTQRVVRAPFDMTWPILIQDESSTSIDTWCASRFPTPGSRGQLDAMISEFLSRTALAAAPAWQLLVIEGLDDGRAVLVMKAHHALADGVSFAETFANLFDISPEVRPPARAGSTTSDDRRHHVARTLARGSRSYSPSVPPWSWRTSRRGGARLYEIVRAFVERRRPCTGAATRRRISPPSSKREKRRSTARRASKSVSCARASRWPTSKRAAKARGDGH